MQNHHSNYGMELDMEVESTIAKLHQANAGFSIGSSKFFTGGYYIDHEGQRIELMSRWRLTQQLSKVAISSMLRRPRPEPELMYDSVSLTIDNPYRPIGRICYWDFMAARGGRSLMDGIMLMGEVNDIDFDRSDIWSSPIPFNRHDYHDELIWTPGSTYLDDYQPEEAHELEQSLIKVVQHGSEVGWQTLWR